MVELVFHLAKKLTEKLGSIAYDEIQLAWGIKTNLQKLERTMSSIKGVLLDAEEKQAHNQDIRDWLQQLKDVFLDAEDLLDEFECKALRRQVIRETYHGTASRKVRRLFSCSYPIAFRLRVGHEIKEIRKRLDELKANKAIFDLLTDHGREHHDHGFVKHMVMRETDSFVRSSEVIGRNSEKEAIIELLKQQGDQSSGSNNIVSVIPIVGIGGLGKTTVAKMVYNDGRIETHFQLRMWVYVSIDFDITRLMKKILSSAIGTKISDELSRDQIQKNLLDALRDKQFLLVLDDVWNEDRIKWTDLRDLLIEGAKVGSKILVTTRNFSVASIMGNVPTYNLSCLSDEHCLLLFVKCAFEEGQEKQHPNLFEIGKDIVRKCGRVPLAVRTLGSQLYSKVDEREWKFMRDSEIWELERERAVHILPALRLSYTQLPPHLKQCLAYCSLFPKGRRRFQSYILIDCWIANGILQSRDHENLELEDVGQLYFKELWARSFFQNVELAVDDYSLYYTFDMHDLIHDLVHSVVQGEWSIIDSSTKYVSATVRHLIFLESDYQTASTLLSQSSNKVRTILFRPESTSMDIDESFLHTCFSRFKYLRVLCVSLERLPSSIGMLKHLRYLELYDNHKITKLASAICKLQSLQTLAFAGCWNLKELPRDISNLINLRSLTLTTKQACFPKNGLGCLKLLRYLAVVGCTKLTSLPHETSYLVALRTLIISDCEQLAMGNENYKVVTLKLQKLVIQGVPRMVALPEWFQGATNTIQDLYLLDCQNLASLPGWLTNLTSLRKLLLGSCPKLLSLPEGMHRLTALRDLKIEDCPELQRRCQRDIGEDWPKIAHIPNLYISKCEL